MTSGSSYMPRALATPPAGDMASLRLFARLVRLHLTRLSLILGSSIVLGFITIASFANDGMMFVGLAPLMLVGLVIPSAPSLFEQSSRIPVRVLLAARLCARALVVFPSLGVGLLLLRNTRDITLPEMLLLQFLCVAVITVAAPFMLHAAPPTAERRYRTPKAVHIVLMTALIFAPLGALFLPQSVQLPLLAVLATVSVAGAFVAWQRAFVAVGSADVEVEHVSRSTSAYSSPWHRRTRLEHWPVDVQLVGGLVQLSAGKAWWLCFIYATVLLLGYGLGLSYVLGFMTVTVSQQLVRETRFLSVLAMSSSRRLAGILLLGPVLLLLLTGVGAGVRIGYERVTRPAGQLDMGTPPWRGAPLQGDAAKGFRDPSRVSLAFWKWAPRGAAPEIVAPWGERVQPYTMAAFGRTLYNPFTVRPANSGRFYGWQWLRLLRTVYGAPLVRTPDEPFPWPPAVTERWPVRVVIGAFVLSGLLTLAGLVWMARDGSAVRQLVVLPFHLISLMWPIMLVWFVPEGGPGVAMPLVQGAVLNSMSWLPHGTVGAGILAAAACVPLMLVAAWLRYLGRQPAFEFGELRAARG
jgi:hypothetical protein